MEKTSIPLTLEQALANTTVLYTGSYGMTKSTVKRWYAQGFYVKTDGEWYTNVGGKEYKKYST